MENKLTIAVDVDDTLSTHINRDYVNAIPHKDVIKKINKLYEEGHHIVLWTGRGMHSCNGDINLIIERNESILKEWLKKYNVKYNELVFGKRLFDCMIDDKCMNVRDFLQYEDFKKLKGGSKATIYKVGDVVIKIGDNVKEQVDWYNNVKNFLNVPKVYSFVINKAFMEYIDGTYIYDNMDKFLEELIDLPLRFKSMNIEKVNNNFFDEYLDNLLIHIGTFNFNNVESKILLNITNEFKHNREKLISEFSFCHGDLTLNNVIIKNNEALYLIDPNFKSNNYNSYLLDLAKIRFSLNGYDHYKKYCKNSLEKYLSFFDERIINIYGNDKLRLVKLLEITHYIRLFKYINDDNYFNFTINKIKNLWEQYKNEYTLR